MNWHRYIVFDIQGLFSTKKSSIFLIQLLLVTNVQSFVGVLEYGRTWYFAFEIYWPLHSLEFNSEVQLFLKHNSYFHASVIECEINLSFKKSIYLIRLKKYLLKMHNKNAPSETILLNKCEWKFCCWQSFMQYLKTS